MRKIFRSLGKWRDERGCGLILSLCIQKPRQQCLPRSSDVFARYVQSLHFFPFCDERGNFIGAQSEYSGHLLYFGQDVCTGSSLSILSSGISGEISYHYADFVISVLEILRQAGDAADLLDRLETVRPEVLFLVDVRNGCHKWTHYDLRVIEEVDLLRRKGHFVSILLLLLLLLSISYNSENLDYSNCCANFIFEQQFHLHAKK